MKNAARSSIIAFISIMGIFKAVPCKAQAQEIQQLILDIEKLTQMKSILTDMKTGYQIYEQGYGSISSLSKGSFDLHNRYLTGLLAVGPAVRNYGRIADILLMEASLTKQYKNQTSLFRKSGSFSVAELSYMSDVYMRLMSQTLNDVRDLTNIITAGKLRMSDADRIKGIDRIYSSSSDRLQFLQSFGNQGITLSLQRNRDAANTQTLKQLYRIN